MILIFVSLISLLTIIILHLLHRSIKPMKSLAPPGPPGLPFIGNLHQLATDKDPHIYLSQLSKKHGPVFQMTLFSKPLLIISSPKLAQQVLKTQDLAFCSRPNSVGRQKMSYNCSDIAFSPYNDSWRELRKITAIGLFSLQKVQSFAPIRADEISFVVGKISCLASSNRVVNLSDEAVALASSLICRVAFGKRYEEHGSEMRRFNGLLDVAQPLFTAFFVCDYFPAFGWVDKLSGLMNRLDKSFMNLDSFCQELIDEHLDPNKPKFRKIETKTMRTTVRGLTTLVRRSARISARKRRSNDPSDMLEEEEDSITGNQEDEKEGLEEGELPAITKLCFKPVDKIFNFACQEYPALRGVFDLHEFKILVRKIGGENALLLEPPEETKATTTRTTRKEDDPTPETPESQNRNLYVSMAEEFLDAQDEALPKDDEDPVFPPGFEPPDMGLQTKDTVRYADNVDCSNIFVLLEMVDEDCNGTEAQGPQLNIEEDKKSPVTRITVAGPGFGALALYETRRETDFRDIFESWVDDEEWSLCVDFYAVLGAILIDIYA